MAAKKTIPCWHLGNCSGIDEPYCVLMSKREAMRKRRDLRRAAMSLMLLHEYRDDPKCDHLVYYKDFRNEMDDIYKIIFYEQPLVMTDEQYHVCYDGHEQEGMIGVIHKVDLFGKEVEYV